MAIEVFMWTLILALWTGIGALLLFVLFSINKTPVQEAKGLEFLNPCWLWRRYKLNVVGAALLAMMFGILCPPLTVGYWIYKLFTAGRKK